MRYHEHLSGDAMKTLAIRLDDELHARLTAVAKLAGTSVTDEIRQAIEAHLTARVSDPALEQRLNDALAAFDREAQSQRSALTALLGHAQRPPVAADDADAPARPAKQRSTRQASDGN